MEFAFAAVVPRDKAARRIYDGEVARVLVHNLGPGEVNVSHGDKGTQPIAPGSALLVEAKSVNVVTVSENGCVSDVRVIFDGPAGAKSS